MYEEVSLAELGEISKALFLRPPGAPSARALARMSPEARAAQTRLRSNTRKPPTYAEQKRIRDARNAVRNQSAERAKEPGVSPAKLEARQNANLETNYGVPHNRSLDAPGAYKHRKLVTDAVKEVAETKVAPAAQKLGSEIGTGATKATEAGGKELGAAAGKGIAEAAESGRKTVQRAGLGILAGGAAGGATFGTVANLRRRRERKQNLKLDTKTGKLVVS